MKATQKLHDIGQSLWIDDITRDMLDSGTLAKYISEFSVTGLTSNPTIFDRAVTGSDKYDDEIRRLMKGGLKGEALFFELALQDLSRAADLFLPVHEQAATVDGWVSLESTCCPATTRDGATCLRWRWKTLRSILTPTATAARSTPP